MYVQCLHVYLYLCLWSIFIPSIVNFVLLPHTGSWAASSRRSVCFNFQAHISETDDGCACILLHLSVKGKIQHSTLTVVAYQLSSLTMYQQVLYSTLWWATWYCLCVHVFECIGLFSAYYGIDFWLAILVVSMLVTDVKTCVPNLLRWGNCLWHNVVDNAHFNSRQFITTHNIETVNDMVFSQDYDCISLQTTVLMFISSLWSEQLEICFLFCIGKE